MTFGLMLYALSLCCNLRGHVHHTASYVQGHEHLPVTGAVGDRTPLCFNGTVCGDADPGIVDSGSTHDIVKHERFLHTIVSRERASVQGMGTAVCTAVGHGHKVLRTEDGFTDPVPARNVLITPAQTQMIFSEQQLRKVGVLRDSLHDVMRHNSSIIPLQFATSGRYTDLLPVTALYVSADGSVLPGDTPALAQEYERWRTRSAADVHKHAVPSSTLPQHVFDTHHEAPNTTRADLESVAAAFTSTFAGTSAAVTHAQPFTFVDAFCGNA